MADLYASFGRFQGGTLEGLRDGKGSCSFANQYFSYNGMWAAGVLQGRGTLTLADGSVYDGAFQNGEMTGTGLRRWGTGASYSGQFVEGELHGRGVHISAEGAQYEGEWVAGKRHGQGVLTATSGDRYTGAFIHNRQSGVRCANALFVVSVFLASIGRLAPAPLHSPTHSLPSGVGTMHYISGDVYHGEWADNVRAGQGTMVRRCTGERHAIVARASRALIPTPGQTSQTGAHTLTSVCVQTFADGATLSGRWTNNAPHRLCSYSTQGGFCYNGAFVGGVATRAATHLVVAPYEEPASVLHLSEMSIAGCPAVAAGDGQLCISVSVLPFVEGGAPTPPTVSVPVSFPEGSAQIAWDDSLTVDVPVGTRRPAAVRLELRRGETVVATGSLSLEAPYALASGAAEHMRTAALVPLRTNDAEAAPIELSVSYAVALAPLPTPAQAEAGSAEVVGGQPGREPTAAAGNDVGVAPEAPPSIHAVGGRAMPPLALRCLRGENVEIAPAIMATVPAKAATGSAKAVKGPVKVGTMPSQAVRRKHGPRA